MFGVIAFYAIAVLLNLISTIFNIQSSLHLNPILLHFYAPKEVLVIVMTLFSIGALARIVLFRESIVFKNLKEILILSFLGSLAGSLLLNVISDKVVAYIFVFSAIYFILQYRKRKGYSKSTEETGKDLENTLAKHKDLFIAGFLASFMQAFGISSGSIRQGFYYNRGHTIQTVHGTVAIIFLTHSITFLISRAFLQEGSIYLMSFVLPITPFIFATTFLSKKILYKIPEKWKDRIVLYSLILALISVIPILTK